MAEILYESNYYGVSGLGVSLEHHGIKGQKWGIRRFQNSDGSLTTLGKQRYGILVGHGKLGQLGGIAPKVTSTPGAGRGSSGGIREASKKPKDARSLLTGHEKKKLSAKEIKQRKETAEKVLKTGAKVAAGAAAAYAVYRLANRPSSMARTLNSIRKMSDEELLERLGRLEREKKVFDITREQQSLYESNTKRILKAAGKGAATTIASAGALYGAKQGIKYAAKASGKDGDKLLREMFPKKK